MATEPDLDPTVSHLVEQAETVMRASGSGDRLQDIGPEDWQRLIDRLAAQAQRDGASLPDGWKTTLARHRDQERLRSDANDARLAEQGEVFSREDDA